MTKGIERRQFWRAVFRSPVRVVTHDGQHYAELLDISLKGALLETGSDWGSRRGQECQLNLGLALGTDITMWARVAHAEGRHVGLRCESIDLDSMTHLRRLVELNSGDPAILDRELASLMQ